MRSKKPRSILTVQIDQTKYILMFEGLRVRLSELGNLLKTQSEEVKQSGNEDAARKYDQCLRQYREIDQEISDMIRKLNGRPSESFRTKEKKASFFGAIAKSNDK